MSLKTIIGSLEASPLTPGLARWWAASWPFLLRPVDCALAKVSKEATDQGASAVMQSGCIDPVEGAWGVRGVGGLGPLGCYKDRSGVQLALAALCAQLPQSIDVGVTARAGQERL